MAKEHSEVVKAKALLRSELAKWEADQAVDTDAVMSSIRIIVWSKEDTEGDELLTSDKK